MSDASADSERDGGIGSTRAICALSVRELGEHFRKGTVSPVEAIDAVLRRIHEIDSRVNAYCAVLDEAAVRAAREAERQLALGIDLGPLHGIPVSVKDNVRVQGTHTRIGCRALSNPPRDREDATVVQRLRAAGAIIIGKVNCDEFATGVPDPEDVRARVENPRRRGYRPGGSSSGSAAAVATGLGALSIGTDTGGSIRHPASVSGVVGLRPTYGLVPMDGVVPLSPMLDVAGPLARSTDDAALALAAMASHDTVHMPSVAPGAMDSVNTSRLAGANSIAGLRLGIPSNPMYRDGQESALALLEHAQNALVALGMVPSSFDLPRAEETVDVSTTLILSDLRRLLQSYPDDLSLGRDLKSRLADAHMISTDQYSSAKRAQMDIRARWIGIFDQVDILALPANLAGAPRHGDEMIMVRGRPMDFRVVLSASNRGASLAGLPALTVPIGALPDGLPIGMQLVGRPFDEDVLLDVGKALEGSIGSLPRSWGIDPIGAC